MIVYFFHMPSISNLLEYEIELSRIFMVIMADMLCVVLVVGMPFPRVWALLLFSDSTKQYEGEFVSFDEFPLHHMYR